MWHRAGQCLKPEETNEITFACANATFVSATAPLCNARSTVYDGDCFAIGMLAGSRSE
jgi:hypothetical protein